MAVVFRDGALSDAGATAGEGGASDAAFANGRLDADVAVDVGGRGACCAFFPCPADVAAAAAAVPCRGVVEMPGGPVGVVREAVTSDDVWTAARPECSLDGEATGTAGDEDVLACVTPACPADPVGI